MSRPGRSTMPKLARPRVAGILARERLFEQLASAAPVAWATAEPGSGKTTLAASYCEAATSATLWYQVDSGDADPATFFHFVRALASTLPAKRAARLPSLPPDRVDLAAFARSFFRGFFALLPPNTVWVIDNFQEAEGASLATILREAFQQIPAGVSIVVLSLVDPPPLLARLVANGTIRAIAPTELRFTRQESDALVLSKLGADQRLLAGIHERSAGWAAGLVLMIEHMRRAGTAEIPSLDESQSAVFDYFAAEILAGCSTEEQRTLLLTASLPRVTAELAEAMSGAPDAGALLERLHRRHLFVDRRGQVEPSYQYHGLFRAFLAARARSLPGRERAAAADRAADLLEAAGRDEDAIAMRLAATNWDAAARLLVRHARRLHDHGRWRTLLDWMSMLPAEVAETPWLLYWAGACQLWSDPPVARRMLERAFDRFTAIGERAGQVLAAGAMTRVCILGAEWSLLDPWIDALSELLAGDTSSLANDVLLVGFPRLLYAAYARRPEHPQLRRWTDRTRALLAGDGAPTDRVFAGYSLIFVSTWSGQRALAEDVVRHVEPLTQDERLSAVGCVHWLFGHANHLWRFGSAHEALAMMDRACELAANHGLTIENVLRRYRVVHLLTIGRLDDAESELVALAKAPHVEPYVELRAWLAWQRGHHAVAIEEAEQALRLATERGRTLYRLLDLALLASIHADAGQPAQALGHLRSYQEATAGVPGEFAPFQAGLAEAFIELSRGNVEASVRPLQEALAIGERQRFSTCWAWSPRMMVPLLSFALGRDLHASYCRDLVRLHRLAPPSPDVERWPWPVRIRTLGRFEIERDGAPLRFEGKAQRKPLEMLKIMVAAGERPLAIAQLIDLLWPNPDDGGRKAFDITVHRLRKLLACEAAVVVADLHATLDWRYAWVDAWALERTLEQLVPVAGPTATGDRLEAAAPRVFAIVAGSFLEGEGDAGWRAAGRVRISARLHRFAERLGEHWEATGHWSKAGQLYQRMVELEPLAASFYRRHMVCLRAEGRRAEAIEVFRRCRHLLATTLGVTPDPELERVYREIVAS